MSPISRADKEALEARFADTAEDPAALLEAVDTANLMVTSGRQARQLENIGRLVMADPENEYKIRDSYQALAGNPELLDTYVRWFGTAATAALVNYQPKKGKRGDASISLELGGMRQDGDWNRPVYLDRLVAALPDEMRALDRKTDIQLAAEADKKLGYIFMPLFMDSEGEGYTFDYAVLRRRRAVMDITMEGAEKVGIFKQSYGLVVLSQLKVADREFIRQMCEAEHNPEWNVMKNNVLAEAAGRVFEAAILAADRSKVTTVVPISAQYIVKARRDGLQVTDNRVGQQPEHEQSTDDFARFERAV